MHIRVSQYETNAPPMPPRQHLVRLRQQGVTDLLGAPPTAAARFEIASHMRPAALPPPHWISVVGPVAVPHPDSITSLPSQLARPLATTGHPAQKHRDHPRHPAP